MVLANVNQDTFGAYLDVASSHRLQRLEAKCIDFLLANFDKVVLNSRPVSGDCHIPDDYGVPMAALVPACRQQLSQACEVLREY